MGRFQAQYLLFCSTKCNINAFPRQLWGGLALDFNPTAFNPAISMQYFPNPALAARKNDQFFHIFPHCHQ